MYAHFLDLNNVSTQDNVINIVLHSNFKCNAAQNKRQSSMMCTFYHTLANSIQRVKVALENT